MSDQPTYQELLKSRKELEEKLIALRKKIQDRPSSRSKQTSDNLFKELFNKAGDIIILHEMLENDQPGKIIMANPAALKRLGYSEAELQKMTLLFLFEKKWPKTGAQEIKVRELLRYERTIKPKNNKIFFAEIHTHIFDHRGDRLAFSIIYDISEHKSTIDALRSSEERYKRLVENLSDEYIFYSHDSTGMITYISPSITKVLGYSQDEALRNFREFLTDHEMNKKSLEHSELSLKGKLQPPFLNEIYHRDGSTRVFYNTEIPIFDEQGNVTNVEGLARDITDTLKAEKELNDQKERFRLLIEAIEEVFWMQDLKEDRLIYISPKYEQLYGRSCDSLYKNPGSFLKAVYPDDVDKVKNAYQQIPKGKGLDLEYRIVGQNGEIKWIWSRSIVITDKRKRPALSIGTAFEITERKEAQHEKNLLASIVENTEDHAVIKDLNLKIIASNRANTVAAGKKRPEEMIGKTDIELYGDHEHVIQYIEDDRKVMKMKKGETLVSEQIFIYPNGRKIHSLVKKFPVFDENNNLIAVASISRDITNYKKAVEELLQGENKYRLLIESLSEGIGIFDSDMNFIFANPGAEEIFGAGRNKLEKISLLAFLDKRGTGLLKNNLFKLKKGEKCNFELEVKALDGNKKPVDLTAIPQFQEKIFSGFVATFRDISKWKNTEKSLRHSEKILSETNVAKDKFFSIIAHDLKNPFNTIMGFSDLLLKHYNSYDKEEVLTFIKMINDSTKLAHNLLENLLSWSRAQTGRILFTPGKTDIFELVTENMHLLGGTAKEKNIQLINKVKENTFAWCDANMVRTVLRNLISNAIKFTKPTGKVTISCRVKSSMVEILVADTGVGIGEADMAKLFRIDITHSTSGTANEEGTGLGLILCKEFIDKHKGTFTVDSKPGKGTTFCIGLPKQNKSS